VLPLAAASVSPAADELDQPAKNSKPNASGDDLVPCTACDEKGRISCARCRGTGKLEKTCPRCEGSGVRPCPVCNDPENHNGTVAEPGRLACGYCGGDGTFGTREGDCPECSGAGVLPCSTCRGKGELKCKPALYDGICSTCRLTGKVECTYCGGTKWAPRSRLALAGAGSPGAGSPGAGSPGAGSLGAGSLGAGSLGAGSPGAKSVNASNGSSPASSADGSGEWAAAAGAAKVQSAPTAEEVERRFAALTELRLAAGEVDVAALQRTTDDQLRRAKAIGKEIESLGSPQGETAAQLLGLRRRVDELEGKLRRHRARITELETLLLEFDSTYTRCQKRLANRPQGPYKTGRQQRELAEWVEDMALSLEFCEKRAVRLEETPPAMLSETSSALEAENARVLKDFEQVTTAARPAIAESSRSRSAKSAKSSTRAANGGAGARGAEIPELASAKDLADAPEVGDSGASQSETASPAATRGGQPRSGGRSGSRPDGEPAGEAEASGTLLYGVLGAVGGFAAAGLTFWAMGRRRRALAG
jgi:hypothetical protein